MKVGVPKEIKSDEYRVAMLPVGALELTQAGHTVFIEAGAGQGSGIADSAYADAGATIVSEAAEIWAEADLIVKVKEPQPPEWLRLRPDQVVFTYFHFAADEALTRAIIDSGVTAIAYETLRDSRGALPLLTPMSEVAGRMSIQAGVVHYCVTNMPGAVGRTSTYALCNVTLPYVLQLASHGWRAVAAADPGVAQGVNIDRGRVTNHAVAATFALPFCPVDSRPESLNVPIGAT